MTHTMGVFETLLLLAGSVIAVATIGMVAYRGFTGRKTAAPIGAISSSSISTPVASVATEVPQHAAEPTPIASVQETPKQVDEPIVQPQASPQTIAIPLASAPVEEAPPPFPEESPKTTNNGTSIPTDVSAVSNIANPTDLATPVLVIATPKIKAPRAPRKRLPTSATPGTTTPRRRRTTKSKISAPQVTVAAPETTAAPSPSVPVESEQQPTV